jgi:hypothetical protein
MHVMTPMQGTQMASSTPIRHVDSTWMPLLSNMGDANTAENKPLPLAKSKLTPTRPPATSFFLRPAWESRIINNMTGCKLAITPVPKWSKAMLVINKLSEEWMKDKMLEGPRNSRPKVLRNSPTTCDGPSINATIDSAVMMHTAHSEMGTRVR